MCCKIVAAPSILAAVVISLGQRSWDLRRNKNGRQRIYWCFRIRWFQGGMFLESRGFFGLLSTWISSWEKVMCNAKPKLIYNSSLTARHIAEPSGPKASSVGSGLRSFIRPLAGGEQAALLLGSEENLGSGARPKYWCGHCWSTAVFYDDAQCVAHALFIPQKAACWNCRLSVRLVLIAAKQSLPLWAFI